MILTAGREIRGERQRPASTVQVAAATSHFPFPETLGAGKIRVHVCA